MIDRGNKKWAGFMLSEHRTALRELYIEQQQEEEKEMDEHAYEEFDRLLIRALEERREVEMTYYKDGRKNRTRGHIVSLNKQQRTIHLQEEQGKLLTLSSRYIITFDFA